MMVVSNPKDPKSGSKYARYTNEQVEALERLYNACPNPSSFRRLQLLKDCKILSNIEPRQIKVWFQNRRCRDKQRKENNRLVNVNEKLAAMNKVLGEENEHLSKQAIKLVLHNQQLRQQLQQLKTADVASDSKGDPPTKAPEQLGSASTETSSESGVTSGLQHQSPTLHPVNDTGPIRLMEIAEETLTEFLGKTTGTAVNWIQMPGMKPGPDTIGIVTISHGCNGIAARACGLVGLEPSKIAVLLKNRTSWLRDCRRMDILGAVKSNSGGLIELLYTQMYTPTTLALPRDFCTLRYTTIVEDKNIVICERSLPMMNGEPTVPTMQNFVRAEVKSSGFLIRPYGNIGSIVHIVDHVDLQAGGVPEVLRPLYESPCVLAQKMTIGALRYLRSVAQEAETKANVGRGLQPSLIRTLCQRVSRDFNEAVNSLPDDGWSLMASDGMDDVTIAINTSFRSKLARQHLSLSDRLDTVSDSVLCAKTSMLLQNVPPAMLIRFLREHRSEWADFEVSSELSSILGSTGYWASAFGRGGTNYGSTPLLLTHSAEEELLELLQLQSPAFVELGTALSNDEFLLQLCTGLDESAVGASAQLAFAPVNVAISEDMHLLASGFRVVPLENNVIDGYGASRTLDLSSAMEGGSGGVKCVTNTGTSTCPSRSILTIAFQFPCDNHSCETFAVLARKYVRAVVASILRVAMAIAPSLNSSVGSTQLPGSPELLMLVRRILQSYRLYFGVELLKGHTGTIDASSFKLLWHHPDAIFCCMWKSHPEVIFANQSGLDMLEISSSTLRNISWEKTLGQERSKNSYSEFTEVMQQGFSYFPGGIRLSSTGKPAAYERAIAWKVDSETMQCVTFMFMNWSF